MADTKISALTDGTTANATDRIPVARSPYGSGDNRYVTPAYVKDYILGLANTWADSQTLTSGKTINWNGDLFLHRAAAAVLALRNSTTAQTFRVYTTWTDASNGEWLEFGSSSSIPYITASANGSGSQRALNLQRVATPSGGSSSAAILLGTTAGFGIYYGSGAPTVSAAKGSLYLRTDGALSSQRMYVNTDGSTTWIYVTASA